MARFKVLEDGADIQDAFDEAAANEMLAKPIIVGHTLMGVIIGTLVISADGKPLQTLIEEEDDGDGA